MDQHKFTFDGKSDMATVLKASQPYGLLSKTTVLASTALSNKIISTSLVRLEKLGMIEERRTAKIEKKGRPEKIYCLTSDGATWLQVHGFKDSATLAMSDPIDLAHRYCQALVGTRSNGNTEIEKVIPLSEGRNIRIDVVVRLSKGLMQFVEIEQKLERSNITRAIEKFRAVGELFSGEAHTQTFNMEILFVFNLSVANLSRTLNIWRDALAVAFPSDLPIQFTAHYTTIDTFMYDPGFENLGRFLVIEKKKRDKLQPIDVAFGGEVFDPNLSPSTKQLLVEMQAVSEHPITMPSQNADQLIDFCEIALIIYRKSLGNNSATRRYSAFPHESIQALRHFLHLSQNSRLVQALKEGIIWIESRKSGLILYRDAVTKLIWDIFLRYFGFGRGGPLSVFVNIPDVGEKFSQITIGVILEKSEDIRLPWTSTEESYEDAISWILTALIAYPVDLGLISSPWVRSRKKL